MLPRPIGIVDIGSNSVRLVVYAGAARAPFIIFNEKVMAGLGKAIPKTGRLSESAQQRALASLGRFAILVRQMKVGHMRVVATAAVRDAANKNEFLVKIRALGLDPEVLSGEEEGAMAGRGVLSAIPEADGIVGDLGGGSLELVDISAGKVVHSISIPLGIVQLGPLVEQGGGALAKEVARALNTLNFRKRGKGRPFYMVGGAWRALARLDMVLNNYPLPITHHYQMPPGRPAELQKAIRALGKAEVKDQPLLSASRLPSLPYANSLLKALVAKLKPSELVVSAFGIREGLLYDALDASTKRLDPLLEAARETGKGLGRFNGHGDLLNDWVAPIFDDNPLYARLRHAACLLSDVAWQAHPDFRAERGVEMALHGNWVGIDATGRALLGQALFTSFGGGRDFADSAIGRLCRAEDLQRAYGWGLAIRLGQRLSGGVAASLSRSSLLIQNGTLCLTLRKQDSALYGETVERRLKALAGVLNLAAEVIVQN